MIVEVMNVNLLDTVTSTVSLTVQYMYSGNVIVLRSCSIISLITQPVLIV